MSTRLRLVIDETGRGHDLSIAEERRVFLRTGGRAEHVARVNRKIDQEPGHFLAFTHIEFTRARLAEKLNFRAPRVSQTGVEPVRDDLLVVRGICAVSRVRRRRSLRETTRGQAGQRTCQEKPSQLPFHPAK